MTESTEPLSKQLKESLLKTKESYMVIEFDYSTKYVMKYDQGIKILAGMNGMEKLSDPYKETATIEPINTVNYPKAYPLSQEKYLELKMNALLKVDTAPDA